MEASPLYTGLPARLRPSPGSAGILYLHLDFDDLFLLGERKKEEGGCCPRSNNSDDSKFHNFQNTVKSSTPSRDS